MEKQTKSSHQSSHTSESVFPNMIPSSSGDDSSSSDETNYQSRSPLHYHDEKRDPSHHYGQELHLNNHDQQHHHHNLHNHHKNTKKSREGTLPSKNNNLSTTTRSEVRFSTIEIRTFPMILGDNPACDKYGPPLTIDWEPESTKKVKVDIYEEFRGRFSNSKDAPGSSTSSTTQRRRKLHDLKIGGFFRTRILRRSGVCTKEEIQKRMDEMSMIRQSRNRSKKWYLWKGRLKEFLFPNTAKDSCVGGSAVTRSSI